MHLLKVIVKIQCNLSQVSHPPPWLNRQAVDEAEKQHAHKSEDLKARNAIPYVVSFIIASEISCFCLRGGLGKSKCQQNTSTSCSAMQELWGSAGPATEVLS